MLALPSQNGASAVWSAVRVDPVLRPSALTVLKSSVYATLVRARGGPGWNWVLLTKANIEVNADPWALIADASGVGPPLADRGATGERSIARAELIGRAPVEHSLRYLGSPGDAARAIRRHPPHRPSERLAKPHSCHPGPTVLTGTRRPALCTPQR